MRPRRNITTNHLCGCTLRLLFTLTSKHVIPILFELHLRAAHFYFISESPQREARPLGRDPPLWTACERLFTRSLFTWGSADFTFDNSPACGEIDKLFDELFVLPLSSLLQAWACWFQRVPFLRVGSMRCMWLYTGRTVWGKFSLFSYLFLLLYLLSFVLCRSHSSLHLFLCNSALFPPWQWLLRHVCTAVRTRLPPFEKGLE